MTVTGLEGSRHVSVGRRAYCPGEACHAAAVPVRDDDVLARAEMVAVIRPLPRASIASAGHDASTQTVRKP